ncbi:MAG: acylphosphatase [Nitrososphaerota archaeon]|nr:acylphosphatase [Nitrososphaerota archaeon]MDG6924140.1 acylphosphatase [Nitrososphaerota archaeon]
MTAKAATITVEGTVQRIGFRRFAERTARKLGLGGHVQNMNDGTVRLFVQGEDSSIEEFVKEVQNAPSPIVVESLVKKESRPNAKIKKNRFMIKTGPLAAEMLEGFGAIESQCGDYRGEFRSFAERTDSSFKSLDTKYGEISAKLTEILKSLQTENVEAIKSLNRSVDTLVKAVEKLSP